MIQNLKKAFLNGQEKTTKNSHDEGNQVYNLVFRTSYVNEALDC